MVVELETLAVFFLTLVGARQKYWQGLMWQITLACVLLLFFFFL